MDGPQLGPMWDSPDRAQMGPTWDLCGATMVFYVGSTHLVRSHLGGIWASCGLQVGFMWAACGLEVGFMWAANPIQSDLAQVMKHFKFQLDRCERMMHESI